MIHMVLLYPLGLWHCHMTAYALARLKVPCEKHVKKMGDGVDKTNCNCYSYTIEVKQIKLQLRGQPEYRPAACETDRKDDENDARDHYERNL